MKPGKQGENLRHGHPLAPEPLEMRRLLSGSVWSAVTPNISVTSAATASTAAGYSPLQIRNAYGLNGVAGTGAGQTIAIVDAYNDPKIASDLATFDAKFGLAAPPSLKVVNQTGGSATGLAQNAGWAGEISLDVEWAHAIAPGANILLVEANNSSLINLLDAVNFARNTVGVSVVSMSWGAGEFYGQTNYDNYFTTPGGHQGVTFIAASGDEGTQYGVEWPASSPNVLSVGGTSLSVTGSPATYSSETPWTYGTGGYSQIEVEPHYQDSVQTTGVRTVPDVAFDADVYTGFAIYDTVPYEGINGWAIAGGTSAGAPQWGAIVAVCDQTRVADKLGTLNGSTQTLPDLYHPYASSAMYAADFHDVTETYSWFGWYSQKMDVGYDLQTGLGTPRGPEIAQILEAGPSTSSSTTTVVAAGSRLPSAQPTVEFPAANNLPRVIHTATNGPGPAALNAAPVTVAILSGTPQSSSQGSSLFNETEIHSAADSDLKSVGISLSEISSPQLVAANASITLASWIGQAGSTLSSWLAGAESSAPGATNAVAQPAGENAKASVANTVSKLAAATLGAPMAGVPAGLLYRFASFDPSATFSDAMADFARESAALSTTTTPAPQSSHRAWLITGTVLAVDAMLAARWYSDRAAKRKLEAKASAPSPQSPQAGPLPTGL